MSERDQWWLIRLVSAGLLLLSWEAVVMGIHELYAVWRVLQ